MEMFRLKSTILNNYLMQNIGNLWCANVSSILPKAGRSYLFNQKPKLFLNFSVFMILNISTLREEEIKRETNILDLLVQNCLSNNGNR